MAKFNTISKRIEELAHPDVEIRRRAARKLGEKGDVRAVQPLCQALQDEDAHVRRAAASALGMLHHPDAMQPLQQALKDRRNGLRGAAAWAIGQIGKHHAETATRAVDLIIEAAHKDKPREISRYVDALLAMELSAAPSLCVELNSRRSNATQQCAQIALTRMVYQNGLDVPRCLLSDSFLAPSQVWDVLEMLETGRPAGFFAARRYPAARRYCELAAANPNEAPEVRQGAKRILEYLSLGRASQFTDPTASANLLRMASPDTLPDDGETLLRGSVSSGEARLQPLSLYGRIAHAWRNMLARLQNRFHSH